MLEGRPQCQHEEMQHRHQLMGDHCPGLPQMEEDSVCGKDTDNRRKSGSGGKTMLQPEPTTKDHPLHLATCPRTATESAEPVSASLATFGPTGLSMVDNHTRLRGIDDKDDNCYFAALACNAI